MPPTNLPEPISELIGRDDVLGEILSLAAAHRLVTLTGAGGIGKAQLAIAAARLLLPQFADGVWLAEFSPIADPGLVSVTVAAPIGLDLGGGAVTARRVSQALAGRRLHPAGAQRSLGQRRGSADHVLARVQHQQPIQPISELLEVEGIIDVVGPLPAELQVLIWSMSSVPRMCPSSLLRQKR